MLHGVLLCWPEFVVNEIIASLSIDSSTSHPVPSSYRLLDSCCNGMKSYGFAFSAGATHNCVCRPVCMHVSVNIYETKKGTLVEPEIQWFRDRVSVEG